MAPRSSRSCDGEPLGVVGEPLGELVGIEAEVCGGVTVPAALLTLALVLRPPGLHRRGRRGRELFAEPVVQTAHRSYRVALQLVERDVVEPVLADPIAEGDEPAERDVP